PAFGRAVAPTRCARAPCAAATVAARRTTFVPGVRRGTRPLVTPRFCIASARLGVETLLNASPTSASAYFLYRPVGIDFLWRIAFLIVRVAPATSSALMIAPPTMTIEAPAFRAWPPVPEFKPPATATGSEVAAATALSSPSG